MTDLTEQFNKGELKLGEHYYYTTIFSPTVYIQNFTRDVISFQDFKETVAEVLAPVPSYEEWQAKLEENAQLKELLKKCVELMGDGTTYMHIDVYRQRKKDVLNAISQALGEDK